MKERLATILCAGACMSLLGIYYGLFWMDIDSAASGSRLLRLIGVVGIFTFPVFWFIGLMLVVESMEEKRAVPYLALSLLLVATVAALCGLTGIVIWQ